MIRHAFPIAGFTLSAGLLCAAAGAQDSVSTTNGLPGDAMNAYTTGTNQQIANYVVDATAKQSSWGSTYRFAPLMKSSVSTSSAYFNHLIAAPVASNRFTAVQPLLRSSYRAWNAAGSGVNPTRNTLGATLASTGLTGQRFGVAMLEFAGGPNAAFGDGDDENNVISGVVSLDAANPARLYVSRITTAVNRPSASVGVYSNSALGLGGVDETGATAILADGLNTTLGDDPVTNKRYYRVDAAGRLITAVNQLRGGAAGDPTHTALVYSTSNSVVVPTLLSTQAAGRPVIVGADFLNNELIEQTAGAATATTTHLTAGSALRGPITVISSIYAPLAQSGADAGLGLALSRGPSETKTRGLSIWALNTDGTTDLAARFSLPTTPGVIVDPMDGFNPSTAFGSLGNHEFMNYQSQVCFRGPSGPLAGTVLPDGSLLMAAGVAATGGGSTSPQSMDNYLAVCRLAADASTTTWTVAAHTGGPGGAASETSKAILGAYGQVIGRIARASEVGGAITSGPSISPPAMDRLGNLYFAATVRLGTAASPTFTQALLKANRNATTGAYALEMLARLDDVFAGANSTKNYQIQYLGVADVDSVDSGTVWPSSIVQDFGAGAGNPLTLAYANPAALGALVFRAKIVYDMNGDGQYLDPSAGNTGSPDQGYNVMMVMLPGAPGRCQPADIADDAGNPLPGGTNNGVNEGDYNLFFNSFFSDQSVGSPADIADDAGNALFPFATVPNSTNNGVNEGDYNAFFNNFFNGC
ncbi:hypothetical protein BH11PLA1_BH11PLA1_20180 [soil metagenome]